ncbi:MAG TPA: EscU/YscU/HrcU family type III secretion system export apparatus switch protein, partial [Vampirovibrionales bacterium]
MSSGEDGASEKRFDPTPRKLQKLRDQGNAPKSKEVAQVATFVVAVMYIIIGTPYIWENILSMFKMIWSAIALKTLDNIGAGLIIEYSAKVFAKILIPLFLLVASTAILMDISQVGLMFSTQRFFKFNNFNPTNYFKNTFSVRGIVELLKQLAKVAILTGVAYFIINKYWTLIIASLNAETLGVTVEILRKIIVDFTIYAAIALLVVGIADLFFQR